MQKDIHPNNHKVKFKCACGNVCDTYTTLKGDSHNVDICSNCHPFYTKKQKIVDTGGRVEKFKKKLEVTEKKDKKK